MIIAIGSGKGGTGKTTVSTNLALCLEKQNIPVQFIDCDVEEPNANLFLQAEIKSTEPVKVMVPEIDEKICTHCDKCAQFCRFNSLAVFPDKVLVFPEMCHSCQGCVIICPANAIKPKLREIGSIQIGQLKQMSFAHGWINIGEARATPVIAKLQTLIDNNLTTILDAPPGTSCPFVETLKQSDICILVTEPTPFGLNDLKLAVEVTENLNIPRGVIINRSDIGDKEVEIYCQEKNIDILLKIPHDPKIAKAYSNGIPIVEALPEYNKDFLELYKKIIYLKEINQ